MSWNPAYHLTVRLAWRGVPTCLLALTFLALPPATLLAQAPGEPISTTVLDPVNPTGAGEGDAADIGDMPGADPLSASGSETAGPRDWDAPSARANEVLGPRADTFAGPGTGKALAQEARAQDMPGPAVDPGETARSVPPEPARASRASPTTTNVQDLLAELWREAVATGKTTQGFAAWLGEVLDQSGPVAPPRPELPADQAGRVRMVSERWLTRAGPVALGVAGRVVTTFGSAIPTAFCAPLTVCYIELEPGEVITGTPSVGDAVRWQVTVKTQGIDPETYLIEIKPAEDAEITNLVIPTDRRLYSINLVNDPEVHTPILSFVYPDSAARRIAEEIAERAAKEDEAKAAAERRKAIAAAARAAQLEHSGVQTTKGSVSADQLDFGFRIEGKAPFRPVRVFADGRRTYIDLHPNYRGALPVIIAGPGEANKALNTRVAQGGARLVADRVIADIWLQAGRKRVRIRKTGS
ncbi:TrbG/VirB9 family P-type conjugative transfer protein [Ruegeria atlantica]|uniref:TrbG/VirB9 family P-type conjugative transfer protein n=1 Tax=Ruegeria atlantica TaxID=81569 RepID=UPI00147E4413|nr:TrbG/VirB9 family P-type conjugative transfer protein [Ruegeria atlantica]